MKGRPLGVFVPTPESGSAALEHAQAELREGRVDAARELAHAALAALKGVDVAGEAGALACLAHCDRLGSRLRRGAETARRAAQLFEELGDMRGEAGALITLTHVCMLLGRNDEAVESALLAVQLCSMQGPHPQSVLALNCLGLAYTWSGHHDRGDALLERAVDMACQCEPAVSPYQPRLNQIWVEASRRLDERYHSGSLGSLARLQRLVEECAELDRAGQGWHVLPGMHAMGHSIWLSSLALLAIWRGDAQAPQAVERARAVLPDVTSWLNAFVHWCAAEQAWAMHDWPQAEAELKTMRDVALSVEHEQLACRAQLLLAQLFERQGRLIDAGAEYRGLRRRERRILAEGMGSRESLVASRLDARLSEDRLKQALQTARQLERWSFEDALTGLANRRRFEQTLAQRLSARPATEQALTVAMIDVDQFKSVNDRHSHHVGDRVLQTVASILASQVRGGDLPARWAGDEFVILFADADEPRAREICQRIHTAVAQADWGALASGLSVTVSIGLSQAREGDTPESVLHRSDESMYRRKTLAADD